MLDQFAVALFARSISASLTKRPRHPVVGAVLARLTLPSNFRRRAPPASASATTLRLVDAKIGKLEVAVCDFIFICAAARSPFVRHLGQQLAGVALGAHPDLGRLGDQRRVFGLPGVSLHRDRLVADGLDLIDAVGLGERAPGGVVAHERGVAHDTTARLDNSENSPKRSKVLWELAGQTKSIENFDLLHNCRGRQQNQIFNAFFCRKNPPHKPTREDTGRNVKLMLELPPPDHSTLQLFGPFFIGTLVTAAFGAFAGAWASSRRETKRAVIAELNSVSAARMLTLFDLQQVFGP